MSVPYKDPRKQREYKREWQRRRREECREDSEDRSGTQLQTPDDVITVLEEQVDALRRDRRLKSTDRAKAIAQLAALALKVIESRDIERKVDDVEAAVRMGQPVSRLGRSRAA